MEDDGSKAWRVISLILGGLMLVVVMLGALSYLVSFEGCQRVVNG